MQLGAVPSGTVGVKEINPRPGTSAKCMCSGCKAVEIVLQALSRQSAMPGNTPDVDEGRQREAEVSAVKKRRRLLEAFRCQSRVSVGKSGPCSSTASSPDQTMGMAAAATACRHFFGGFPAVLAALADAEVAAVVAPLANSSWCQS